MEQNGTTKDNRLLTLLGLSKKSPLWSRILSIISLVLIALLVVGVVAPFGKGLSQIGNMLQFMKLIIGAILISLCAILRVLAIILERIMRSEGKL